MKKELIELNIKAIALDEKSQMPFILLKEKNGNRYFPIPIGPFEASAIIIEMENVHPPRPLTHDLFANFFIQHGYSMKLLEIYGILEDKYLSRLSYSKGLRSYSMECRPSDGIALALRLNATVYAQEELLRFPLHKSLNIDNLTALSTDFLVLDAGKPKTTYM